MTPPDRLVAALGAVGGRLRLAGGAVRVLGVEPWDLPPALLDALRAAREDLASYLRASFVAFEREEVPPGATDWRPSPHAADEVLVLAEIAGQDPWRALLVNPGDNYERAERRAIQETEREEARHHAPQLRA
ncbi:MAG: hypothetical protein HY720_02285 [Planctomycetes bacterium]|nr:hypothetical protein [Planctomycetota bacterium]